MLEIETHPFPTRRLTIMPFCLWPLHSLMTAPSRMRSLLAHQQIPLGLPVPAPSLPDYHACSVAVPRTWKALSQSPPLSLLVSLCLEHPLLCHCLSAQAVCSSQKPSLHTPVLHTPITIMLLFQFHLPSNSNSLLPQAPSRQGLCLCLTCLHSLCCCRAGVR